MAEPRASPALAIALVIIVLIAGGAGALFLYYQDHPAPASPQLTVQVGDNVTVNYIGIFGAGPQQGRVFDTSEYAVALNNLSWPKSLQYSSRGGQPSDYTPLPVYVGGNGPGSGYTIGNLTFSSVVPGFWQGLLGLPGNRTHYITVPPSLGYSFVNSSCFATQPLTTTYPVLVSITPSEFSQLFANVSAAAGTVFTDPVYGWEDIVLSVNATTLIYQNLPTLGLVTNPSGWPVVVTNISASSITLTSRLNPNQAGLIAGHSTGAGLCSSNSFIISQVNLAAGTYVEDYNHEVDGATLVFIVSVVDILRP